MIRERLDVVKVGLRSGLSSLQKTASQNNPQTPLAKLGERELKSLAAASR